MVIQLSCQQLESRQLHYSIITNQILCRILNVNTLPKAVKRRVYALKRLQGQCSHIEAKFYEEVHELERKYAGLYQPIFEKVFCKHFFLYLRIY